MSVIFLGNGEKLDLNAEEEILWNTIFCTNTKLLKQNKVKNKCVLKWDLNSEFLDHSASILSLCCRFAWKKIEVISTPRSCQENMMSVVKYNVDCCLWVSTKRIEHESTIFRFCNCLESFIKIGT